MSDGIRLPNQEELQRVTDLVTGGGVPFASLYYEVKIRVIELAVKADISDSLAAISGDSQDVGHWFRLSKLWEGM